MATFYIPKDEPVVAKAFDKDELMGEFNAWVVDQDVWVPIYGGHQINKTKGLWDVLLVRSVELTISFTASPAFNPYEATRQETYQQVVAIAMIGPDHIVNLESIAQINQWVSALIITDNMSGIHRNLDRLVGE